jgi:hypothetical protein
MEHRTYRVLDVLKSDNATQIIVKSDISEVLDIPIRMDGIAKGNYLKAVIDGENVLQLYSGSKIFYKK